MRAKIISNEWPNSVPALHTGSDPFHYIAIGAEVEIVKLRPNGSAIVEGPMFDDPDCIIPQDINPEHFAIIEETINAN